MRKDHRELFIEPQWEALRSLFTTDPANPTGFHLSDMRMRKGDFESLKDSSLKSEFTQSYLQFLEESEVSICCVLIDKQAQRKNYEKLYDSYRVALRMLLKRYVQFLANCSGVGDVIVEGRSGADNELVKDVYKDFYNNGHDHVTPQKIQPYLSTAEIKIGTKMDRMPGLEISDMLASPMKFWVLEHYGIEKYDSTRDATLGDLLPKSAEIAKTKLITGQGGVIEETGIKIFPSLEDGFGDD